MPTNTIRRKALSKWALIFGCWTLKESDPSKIYLYYDLGFLKWQKDGADWSSTTVTAVTLDVDHTLTAVYGPIPTFTLTVASTNPTSGVSINASPNDNGGLGNGTTQFTRTFVRGPFPLSNSHNFSADQRTRLLLFTSNLGLTQADLNDPSVLVVELAGVNLPVENVGAFALPELPSSYIVVRLPDNLPAGVLQLKIKLRGVTSNTATINISP